MLNVPVHTLALDGVYAIGAGGALAFRAAAPPADAEIAQLVVRVRTRVTRLLARRGVGRDSVRADPLVEASPVLAGITGAAVLGRVALGPRAGTRVWRLGAEADAPWLSSTGPGQAHVEGFDLHAHVRVGVHDRRRLEGLCRYLLRPPLAQERVRLRDDGRVVVELKRAWRDGTTHLVFEPLELLEKLAALTPRPRVNLIVYHGVLAPHAPWRRRIVATLEAAAAERVEIMARVRSTASAPPRRGWRWADLMRRTFDVDVLACPRCGSRLRVLATIEDPGTVRAILGAVGLSSETVRAAPAG